MFLTVTGRKIYYEKIGEGSPPSASGGGEIVFMFHGWGGSRASLRPLATKLQQDRTCYLFDLPGFGQSDMPGAEWGIEEYADCMAGAIQQLIVREQQVDLLGHSFGGAVALALTAKYPSLVSHLVVVAPSWHRKQHKKHTLLHTLGKIPGLKQVGYRLLFPHSDMLTRPDLESNFRKITNQDLTETVRKIKTPTLILTGDRDTYVPVADAYALHDLIPGSILKVYEGSRHALPLEESSRIAPDISHFALS